MIMKISRSLDELRQYVEEFTTRRGFDDIAATLGLQPQGADGSTISLRMPLREALAQANGMFSAAALFGAADITGTFLAMQAYADEDQFPLAVQSSQNFLSNSKEPYAVATARLLRGGGKVAVVEVGVADALGKQLMHATFTYVLAERSLGR
jgi:acyl-coenzyme A thioesterase PaaI-like protein